MNNDNKAAPAGSSHQIPAFWPISGNRRDMVLKITSVRQSWARAWTWVVFMGAQPNQMIPLRMTVAAMAPIAMGGRAASLWSPLGRSLVTDSRRIWRKDITIIMENTRIPRGSRRRRPTGNFRTRNERRQFTRRLVVQSMPVQRRSRAESRREAIRDREFDWDDATALAARRRMFAATLTLMAQRAFFAPCFRVSCSSSGSSRSMFSPASLNAPDCSMTPSWSASGSMESITPAAMAMTSASTSIQSFNVSF